MLTQGVAGTEFPPVCVLHPHAIERRVEASSFWAAAVHPLGPALALPFRPPCWSLALAIGWLTDGLAQRACSTSRPAIRQAGNSSDFISCYDLDALSYIQPVCSPGSLPRSHSSTLPRCCLATSRRSRSEVRGRRACVCMCGRGEGDGVSRMTKTASAAAGPYIFRLAVYA